MLGEKEQVKVGVFFSQYLNGPYMLNKIFIDSFMDKKDTIIDEKNKVEHGVKALIYTEFRRVALQRTQGIDMKNTMMMSVLTA